MKRKFTFIFSFYLLALAIVPCCYEDDCKYVSKDQFATASADHSDHDSDTEPCSPFCICAGCVHTFIIPVKFYSFSQSDSVIASKITIYNAPVITEVYLSIWQPPKLS